MSADKSETPRTDAKWFEAEVEVFQKYQPPYRRTVDVVDVDLCRQLERDLTAAHEKIARMRKSQSEPVMWGISINDHIYNAEFHKAFAEQKIQASKDAEGQYPSRYEIVPLFRALKE